MPFIYTKVDLHARGCSIDLAKIKTYDTHDRGNVFGIMLERRTWQTTIFLQVKVDAIDSERKSKRICMDIIAQWRKRKLIGSQKACYELLTRQKWNAARDDFVDVILKEDGALINESPNFGAKKAKTQHTCFMCLRDRPNVYSWDYSLQCKCNVEAIVRRFGCQYLCIACHGILQAAEVAAASCLDSPEGLHMKHCWTAFLKAEAGELPIDSQGFLHSGILFYRRCRANPWHGRTAREAIAAAKACKKKGDEHVLSELFKHYLYVKCHCLPEPCTCMRKTKLNQLLGQPALRKAGPMVSYLRNVLAVSPFMLPFYLLLTASLSLSLSRKTEAEKGLEETWTTGWGGGLVINLLLFGKGRRVVASSATDQNQERILQAQYLLSC